MLKLDKFIGVFDQSYAGGDFCAGMIYGMQGINMLQHVAHSIHNQHKHIKKKIADKKTKGPEVPDTIKLEEKHAELKAKTRQRMAENKKLREEMGVHPELEKYRPKHWDDL